MHQLELAFLIIIPGNEAAFTCHSEKIFRRCSGRMNFLRITGDIDDAGNAGERSKTIKTVPLIGHRQGENAVFLQERITIVEKPNQIGGVFENVRPDDPVVNVAPADELHVRPAIPNEIDLLDVVDVDPVRPIFFDQRFLVAMIEHVNVKTLLFRRDRSTTRPDPEAQAIALDVRQNYFLSPHHALTRWTMPLLRNVSEASLK